MAAKAQILPLSKVCGDLFEGAEALTDVGSTEAIARALDLPIVLVISARSITRSAAAVVKGFQAFSPDLRIKGVILNNVMGPKHADKAITAIEHYCRIPVIGAIPRMDEMELTMRHLGLVPFIERQGSNEFTRRIERVTGLIGEHVSLDAFCDIASDIPDAPGNVPLFREEHVPDTRIAVARDEAFNFYYSDLFDILPALGASVVPFSPIRDRLPDADGYIIGGGYPELFLPGLESNTRMREAIREQSANDVPIYAECGGLMYLTRRIRLMKGWQGSFTGAGI